ncbi:MarR family transcriptional regulator [Candidatus Woesearchaeota archaeon]|nr:MarR family transcriptional regulator [Candidatus Woesearchaeota archaeon]
MKLLALVLLVLALPLAAASEFSTDISISGNDIVTEDISLTFDSPEAYDSFIFSVADEPLSVGYDGGYAVTATDGGYEIEFMWPIAVGENTVGFTLLFDGLVLKRSGERVFRTAFSGGYDSTTVRVTLPDGFTLSSEGPAATPPPDTITTDGRRITLAWAFPGDAAVAVFYEGPDSPLLWLLAAVAAVILIAIWVYIFFLNRAARAIDEVISEDERRVLDAVRGGEPIQKKVAEGLSFSKSKMSKVVRRLEEKGLIAKEPHFKTNRLKLKKKI